MGESVEQSLRDGVRQQQDMAQARLDAGAARLGWKAGFGTAAAMQKLGTSGPLVGFLTDSTVTSSGSIVDVAGWGKPVLEPEVAVLLSEDVEPGASCDRVDAAVGGVAAAIELVDLAGAGEDPGAILAVNVFHRAVVLGEFVKLGAGEGLASVRLDAAAMRPDDPAAERMDARAIDPAVLLGDLAGVIGAMADLLAFSEGRLRSGDVIITGAAVTPLELVGGESAEVRVRSSSCSVRIVSSCGEGAPGAAEARAVRSAVSR